ECGYPPFLQTIINGHGNEAQINRDFLSMGIALYGENEEPYRYAAYCILEQLVPMRAFEYRSARHNQGIGYGSYRFNFEMHAAWLMRRMAGREIFDPGIRDVYYYWLYARQPDGSMIMDGDRSMRGGYYKNIPVTFMCSTYAANPIFKGEFQRQGGTENINLLDPLIFLMINDPDLKGDPDLSKLPTAHLFRGPLASIIFRTGWNIAPDSNDALVEMKASEYNNANHQHVDAGAFQIYFRGELATDLGMYKFSGTPYDFGFNKRSVAHNVMLIHDPAETFERGNPSNDGGQRVVSRTATSVKMLTSDPHFHTAETRFMAAGPDLHRPEYAYFRSNLAPAYSDKIRFYERSFCTLKFADPERPVALITIDRVESARADHPKYYQLNTLRAPVQTPEGLTYLARRKNPGKLTVQMLLPENPAVTVLSGKKAWDIFGKELAPPLPKDKQANGTRTLFAPSRAQKDDLFVTVLQAGGETSKPYPVQWKKGDDLVEISIGEWLAVLSTAKKPLNGTFYFTVPEGCKKVVLCGLAAGEWRLDCGKEIRKFSVNSLEGTAYLEVPAGMCRISR
ncbi:MAG: heparinase II/III family protein, partial [Lentisphaeria bacterium]|nr:heparinase II/III family protein [Lentisphaeria bacterium]